MSTSLSARIVSALGPALSALLALAVAAVAGLAAYLVLLRLLRPGERGRPARKGGPEPAAEAGDEGGHGGRPEPAAGGAPWGDGSVRRALVRHCRRPAAWTLPVLFAALVHPSVSTGSPALEAVGRILTLLLIVGVAWFVVGLTGAAQDLFLARFDTDVADNLRARRVHTQVGIVRKILMVVIGILALGAVLMSYERLRELGAGILASAGIAGLVVGLAAQRTLANVLAGFQIALTQPIRIDDVVIVEDEWGWIEEITLTYVVVRVWDQRRLVVPISHFIEKPFQNWTRTSAEILGTVFLRVDYTVPVEELRREVGRLVEKNEHWDGRVWRLHVTDAGDRTLELRALMSAADSPSAWELRCRVREELVEWVRREHPQALPRFRAEVEPPPPGVSEAA